MTTKTDCIITIELGTNEVRMFAFDTRGVTLGDMKGSYPTFHSQPDYSEQDPEQIFITMLYVLKNLLTEKVSPRKYNITCICFSASMHSLLAIDKNGIPLGRAITWADNRGKQEAKELKNSAIGKTIYEATGTPIHPMSPLVKIAWYKNHDKEKFKQANKFISVKSYVIQQLTGEYLTDYSIASASGLMNIHKLKWDAEALAYAGIKSDKLTDLASVFSSPGPLKKQYQKSLGLPASTKIIIGSSDGCLATLGAGVWEGNKAVITIQDSGAVRVVGNKILKDEKRRFFNYLLTEKHIISGGPTNSGGVIFEWFARQFGDFSKPYDLEFSMENMMNEASKLDPGSEGLLFLPYLLGERAPIWNPNARGVYFGLNIKHEKQHFVRATIEGILYEIYSIGKILEQRHPIKGLSVHGNFASLPLCAQIIADMFDKPVASRSNADSIAFGAFLLSATEMGIYKDIDEAAQTAELADQYFPRKHHHSIYMDYFKIFERLSTKLAKEFEDIALLQQQ